MTVERPNIQISPETLAEINRLTKEVGQQNEYILKARDMRTNMVPHKLSLHVWARPENSNPTQNEFIGMPAEYEKQAGSCLLFLKIIEIFHRDRRAHLISQLYHLGITLTDQPDLGVAPTWPQY